MSSLFTHSLNRRLINILRASIFKACTITSCHLYYCHRRVSILGNCNYVMSPSHYPPWLTTWVKYPSPTPLSYHHKLITWSLGNMEAWGYSTWNSSAQVLICNTPFHSHSSPSKCFCPLICLPYSKDIFLPPMTVEFDWIIPLAIVPPTQNSSTSSP